MTKFRASALKQHIRPIVYGWYRDGTYLYIGCSKSGIVRLFTHDIIKWKDVLDTDEFHFWTPPEHMTILELELDLLIRYKPPLNKPSTYENPITQSVKNLTEPVPVELPPQPIEP